MRQALSPLDRHPSWKRALLYLLVASYAPLLLISALCSSTAMPLEHALPGDHHNTGHVTLCSWACHVSHASSSVLHAQETSAILLISLSLIPWRELARAHRPLHCRTARGPPLLS